MLGYMTKNDAKRCGFTHHARYWMVPCWYNDKDNSLITKMWLPIPWIDIGAFLDNTINSFSSYEPVFRIEVGNKI